ncbi:hypothetical protein DL96DRAFT_1709536 [Flagelloscypha sp. PMI_526]|nr:hypothetical protein DL96DRAFT_1709536 [Flagelloscypha sp. PMI_526]
MSEHGRQFPGDRPTLPSIRDLFRDVSESPIPSSSLTLARLDHNDHDDPRSLPYPLLSSRTLLPPLSSALSSGSSSNFTPSLFSPLPSDSPSPYSASSSDWHPVIPPRAPGSRDRSWSHDTYDPQRQSSRPRLPSSPHRTSIGNYSLGDDNRPLVKVARETHRPHPYRLSLPSVQRQEEDEQTPVQGGRTPSAARSVFASSAPVDKVVSSSSTILEKNVTFVCPVEGCGRCFSVLSNMRRHSRVHNQGGSSASSIRGTSTDGSDRHPSPPPTASSVSSQSSTQSQASSAVVSSPSLSIKRRAGSVSSVSSTSST